MAETPSLGMSRQLLVICVLCFMAMGSSFPIIITRGGGNSARRRRQREQRRARYIIEEKRRVNTCCLTRTVNPDIKIGECPNVINDYKQLYSRDSVSLLKDYYKHHCDIVWVRENPPSYFSNFLTMIIIFLVSLAIASYAPRPTH
jgi:hypothetical protein